MELFVGLLFIILTLIYVLYRRTFYYWKNLGVLQFDFTLPHGNAKGLMKDVHFSEFLAKYYKKVKEVGCQFGGIYVFIRPALLIVDLDLVKTILVKDSNYFPNRGIYYNEKDDPVSAHLFNLEDNCWRNLRQKMSSAFSSAKLRYMFETITEVADKLLNAIDKQISETGHLEVKDTLARFTTDVIGSTAFGVDCNSLEDPNSELYKMGIKFLNGPPAAPFFVKVLRSVFKDLARKLHIKALPQDIAQFYMDITKKTVDYREKNSNVVRKDFMNILIEMKRSNEITVEQIAAQSFIFYLAGYETSASTITHCMFEIAVNETIQEKARHSVKTVLAKYGILTYDAVADMEYLDMCIEETLRKYPVVPFLQRISVKEYKIPDSNVIIPKGQLIFIPVHAIHHDEEIYKDPENFNPDRFTAEEKRKRHQLAWIPFGEGQRVCIGMRFAITEIKLSLAKLLLNYTFSLDYSKTSSLLKMNPKNVVFSSSEPIYLNIGKIKN